jgi:hypothetical protein
MALISNMKDKMKKMGQEMERLQREPRREFVAQDIRETAQDPYVEECFYPGETVCPKVPRRAHRGKPGFVACLCGKVKATKVASSRMEGREQSFMDEEEGMEVEDLHGTPKKTVTSHGSLFEGLEDKPTIFGSRDYQEVGRERREKKKKRRKRNSSRGVLKTSQKVS